VLTLLAGQPECLWDDALPVEVKELPEDLAALDGLLSDRELLWPIVERWQREFQETGRLVLTEGRPTIAMETFVRLMVLKQRYGWGYRTLVAEVSDSIHLRRFCRIALSERVPDESTDDSYCDVVQRLFGFVGGHASVPPVVRGALGGAVRGPPGQQPRICVRWWRVGRHLAGGGGDGSGPGAG
jgi:hypothetical protein